MVLSEPCQMKIYMLSKRHKCMGNGSVQLFFMRFKMFQSDIPRIYGVMQCILKLLKAFYCFLSFKKNKGRLKSFPFSANESNFQHHTHLFYSVDFQITIHSTWLSKNLNLFFLSKVKKKSKILIEYFVLIKLRPFCLLWFFRH